MDAREDEGYNPSLWEDEHISANNSDSIVPRHISKALAHPQYDEYSVFVGNLGYHATISELNQIFGYCGPVLRVTIIADRFKMPKGYAYIRFKYPSSVPQAIQLTGTSIGGRRIRVSEKRINVPGLSRLRRGLYYKERNGDNDTYSSGYDEDGGYHG
ncbi:polyadenylate-binding protein 2-like [Scaptodrosophila lebanonensis]|uniref:Polyadenylate-binding protein 2-like n=1 Tax=Drosophila lebanonensis TaxID=7225 RepID=A0A6J2TB61_DROLE|nr:polyadenylate-binding protein 2-like [Scaptodrosophila lebanonensis]